MCRINYQEQGRAVFIYFFIIYGQENPRKTRKVTKVKEKRLIQTLDSTLGKWRIARNRRINLFSKKECYNVLSDGFEKTGFRYFQRRLLLIQDTSSSVSIFFHHSLFCFTVRFLRSKISMLQLAHCHTYCHMLAPVCMVWHVA